MTISKVSFNPVDGLRDKDFNPNPPTGGDALKIILQTPLDQIRDYINNVLTAEVDLNFATKAEVAGIVAGTIPNGTITVAQLAFDPTEQPELDAHIADYVRNPGYGTDIGTLNALAVTLSPAPNSYVDGMCIAVKVANTNTATATINVNSLGVKTILDGKGNVLTAGKLTSGVITTLRYNGTNFQLQGEGSDVLTGTMVASDLALGKTGYSTDPLIKITGTKADPTNGTQTYSTPGAVSFTVPSGIVKLTAQMWGAGGAGGSGSSTGQGGQGGGAGEFILVSMAVTPGQIITGSVGLGGTKSTGNSTSSGNGGDTSFGTFTAHGGRAGYSGAAVTSVASTNGSWGGAGTGSSSASGVLIQFDGGLAAGVNSGITLGSSGGGAASAKGTPTTPANNANTTISGSASTNLIGAGGNGGAGASIAGNNGEDGTQPGGGGGGSSKTSTHISGAGGDGKIVVIW